MQLNQHKTFLFVFLCFSIGLGAQNLVRNPSFEKYHSCPERLGNFHSDVLAWSVPTDGSTDYFNGCSDAMGTPVNFNGQQGADFGKGYAGLYLYAPNDYREYLQASLEEGLVQGATYRISFYVSLAERSDFAVKDFDLCFSVNPVAAPTSKVLSKMHLYRDVDNSYTFLEIKHSGYFSDTRDWHLIQGEFVAGGNERYVTIGNLKSNKRTRIHHRKKRAKQGAYYYLDMVKLELAENDFRPEARNDSEAYVVGEARVFRDVLFRFDKYALSKAAESELTDLYQFLQGEPGIRIVIKGHTDNIGTEEYNLILSRRRCEVVADYLHSLGLEKDRIEWSGKGGAHPIADNSTEAGRQRNRRVEFMLVGQPGASEVQ
ncbi:OmpA family protein [Zeaxanthinibacter sp. PT1]|uniref:OmpA family protein n=1 Tax=Zeaxanthinibacter TaxID=561554 RepID=UPI0023499186|nr:OmpA family protein [Zeaxanthinibacter sp. PT1]MDC6352387.1 OmpA family protein [Zeaxanthinibacter sp. PT1]